METMRHGMTRRGVLGGLMLSGALGLGGCVTTPSGSASGAAEGGPDGASVSNDVPAPTYAESATSGGVMVVLSREPGAPTDDITFGLLPVRMNGDEISVAAPNNMLRATVRPPESETGRLARTFEVPPGTYILAHTDFGKPSIWSKRSSSSPTQSASSAIPYGTDPVVGLAAVVIGLTLFSLNGGYTGGNGGAPKALDLENYDDGSYRHHFARDGRVVDARAVVFTVAPGSVTYIGDFAAIKTPNAGVRTLEYRYETDFSLVEEPPRLPTSLDVIKRPTDEVVKFYHAA